MNYQKPELRGLDKESDMFCRTGSSASGGDLPQLQCLPVGSTPGSTTALDACWSLGSSDSNNYFRWCDFGISVSIDSACNTGNSV